MSQETVDTPIADEPRPAFEWTRWKIVTFSIAGVLVLGGALLAFAGGGAAGDPDLSSVATGPGGMGTTPGDGNALLPGTLPGPEPGPGETPEPAPGETAVPAPADGESGISYSPAMLRGGISFFAAFALAFAFRSFLKLALILVGIWFGVMFYLSWLGWIEVRWDVMDAAFQSMASGLGDQFQSVQSFVTGSLPSAGMAGLGLYTGFRRK
jgi:uncharacterized membrane protein (Fun14 family)